MVFVKPAVRKSLLAKMLAEILDTRVMIKHAMKGCRNDKVGQSPFSSVGERETDSQDSELIAERSTTWSEAYGGVSSLIDPGPG
jgi:hypothetical protein